MSTSPVTLDFSKAQPVQSGVQLDFSKAQPINPPAQPEDKRSFLQVALDNSPSGADPENPGNPTRQGLNQMSPEDRESAQKELATTAGITAAGTAAAPVITDALGLGKEYLEFYGKEGLQKIAEMAAQHPEATKHIARTLAGLLVGEGFGAGHAKSAALGLLLNLIK